MPSHAFTISKLAAACGVGVETVRYYQRRQLLAEPSRKEGGFRSYDDSHVQRLNFIKRTQELGFSLEDAGELLALSDGTNNKQPVREMTQARVRDIRQKITQLEAMAQALETLSECCVQSTSSQPCPIIAALAN